jgi:alpha,alpha-trehalase
MRVNYLIHLITWVILYLFSPEVSGQYRPDKDIRELFHRVQTSGIFSDSKTFCDAIPLYSPDSIYKYYLATEPQSASGLKRFLELSFRLPQDYPLSNSTDPEAIDTHLQSLWPKLTRNATENNGSAIGLPYPYVVPGGRFQEMYYWDSYFTMLGLKASGRQDLVENMTDNFAYLLKTYGFIPNGTRSYYLSRSQPPFFSKMVELLAEIKGDSIYNRYLPYLLVEYNFWMDGSEKLRKDIDQYRRVVKLPSGEILNRHWDDEEVPRAEAYKEDMETGERSGRLKSEIYRNIRAACESGWDFSSRWFKDGKTLETIHTTEIIPVDLNSLLYHLELSIVKAYSIKKDKKNEKLYTGLAEKRKKAILKYCWESSLNLFTDYDFVEKRSKGVASAAMFYPLFFNLADKYQAEKTAQFAEKELLKTGGIASTLSETKQQWDLPNGWPPLQWIAYKGLKNYQLNSLADSVKNRYIRVVENTYSNSGKMMEKYNVLQPEIPGGGGEYPGQDGFGWTNGVYLLLKSGKE